MDNMQYLKNLEVPKGSVDVILDTDTFNEVDDQFAVAYLLRCGEKLNVKGICAAPFLKKWVGTPARGMEESYQEIGRILELAGRKDLWEKTYRGSEQFLEDEQTPVLSDAARFLAEASRGYSPENPLYIIAIGAITNVASAFLLEPGMKENTVVIWLGGHAVHVAQGASEYNMRQDIAAARVVLGSGVPLVLLPCKGVVDRFATTGPELEYWLGGKNALCDYLVQSVKQTAESYAKGKPWSRVIWDVTAVAWLMNEGGAFMQDRLIPAPIPQYDQQYSLDPDRHLIRYVHQIKRDSLFEELFRRLGEYA